MVRGPSVACMYAGFTHQMASASSPSGDGNLNSLLLKTENKIKLKRVKRSSNAVWKSRSNKNAHVAEFVLNLVANGWALLYYTYISPLSIRKETSCLPVKAVKIEHKSHNALFLQFTLLTRKTAS